MANEIQLPYPTTGLTTLYAVIRNSIGQAYNTSTPAYEAYTTANLANYAISLTEQGVASRYYTASVPSTVPADQLSIAVYLQGGGSPAEGDTYVGGGVIDWTGAAVMAYSVDGNGLQYVDTNAWNNHPVTVDTNNLPSVNAADIGGVVAPANIGVLAIDTSGNVSVGKFNDGTNTLTVSVPASGTLSMPVDGNNLLNVNAADIGAVAATLDTNNLLNVNAADIGAVAAAGAFPTNFNLLGIDGSGNVNANVTKWLGNSVTADANLLPTVNVGDWFGNPVSTDGNGLPNVNSADIGGSTVGAFPTNFNLLAIDGSGNVSLAQSLPTNFSALAIDTSGNVSLSQTFPTNFNLLSIDGAGNISADVELWLGNTVYVDGNNLPAVSVRGYGDGTNTASVAVPVNGTTVAVVVDGYNLPCASLRTISDGTYTATLALTGNITVGISVDGNNLLNVNTADIGGYAPVLDSNHHIVVTTGAFTPNGGTTVVPVLIDADGDMLLVTMGEYQTAGGAIYTCQADANGLLLVDSKALAGTTYPSYTVDSTDTGVTASTTLFGVNTSTDTFTGQALYWTTGANAGLWSTIQSVAAAPTTGLAITLAVALPNIPADSDTFVGAAAGGIATVSGSVDVASFAGQAIVLDGHNLPSVNVGDWLGNPVTVDGDNNPVTSMTAMYDGTHTGALSLSGAITIAIGVDGSNLLKVTAQTMSSTAVDAILDQAAGCETNLTVRQFYRLVVSALASKEHISGSTVTFRDYNDTKDRITATCDDTGQRTAVTTDPT